MGDILFGFRVPGQIFGNVRILFSPNRTFPRNAGERLPMLIILPVFNQCFPIAVPHDIDGFAGFFTFFNNQIVFENHIMTAVQKKRALAAVHDISENRCSTVIVVAVNRKYTDACFIFAFDVMKIIIPYDIAAARIVSASVYCGCVVGVFADAENLVVFDDMLISAEKYRLMHKVVNTVMGNNASDAVNLHAGTAGLVYLGVMMEMIVCHKILR